MHALSEETSNKQADMVVSQLRDIQGEFAQLSELEETEANHARKLVDSLRLIQSAVDDVVPLNISSLGDGYANAKDAYLASDCVVVVTKSDGSRETMPLSKLGSREILAVVQEATPLLKKLIMEKRKAASDRVELLERILKEFKKAGSSLRQGKPQTESAEQDLVSRSLASE